MTVVVGHAGALFDYAAEKPDGFLAKEACRRLGLSIDQFYRAARALRRILSTDSINLVCIQRGFGESKRYYLVGTFEKAGPWVTHRMRGVESQLESVLAVTTSIVNSSDGRTVDGKKARLVTRHVGRLIEDLGELEGRLPAT